MRRVAVSARDRGSTSRDVGAPSLPTPNNIEDRKDDEGVIGATTSSPEGR